MTRDQLEVKMTDMLDAGYSGEQERQLLEQLQPFPDLLQDWQLLSEGLPELHYDDAYAMRPAPPAFINSLREQLQPGFLSDSLQWFPGYFAAAALMLITFTGLYSLSTDSPSEITGQQISDWVYMAEEEQQLQQQELLVQELPFMMTQSPNLDE